jgi:hypothetical protein
MRRAALSLLLVAAVLGAWLLTRPGEPPAVERLEGRVLLRNDDATWTVFTECRPELVGPGYVARVETADGNVLVDDAVGPGTLNDTDFGGLGAFGWHHSRGRAGALRFTAENAWEVSARTCATTNGGFGVAASRVVELGEDSLEIEVDLSDGYTYPEPVMRVRYRYVVEQDELRSWVTVTELCDGGRCGRTDDLAFLKEPKLVAHLTGAYDRMDVLDGDGRQVCSSRPVGPPRGPILETTQCDDPARARVRFGPCEPVCLEVEAHGWNGVADGFDAWAVAAAERPLAFPVDTGSIDGVLWGCHGGAPNDGRMRRWELAGRKGRSLGALFPAWEGGRGGYDCEPLARTFGREGETWRAALAYTVVR